MKQMIQECQLYFTSSYIDRYHNDSYVLSVHIDFACVHGIMYSNCTNKFFSCNQ